MTIEIRKPELEALIHALRARGENVDEMIFKGLSRLHAETGERNAAKGGLAQILCDSPLRGLDLKFERSKESLRTAEL